MFGTGAVMLPMHIPVMICGMICGAPYGAICGFLLPYISSLLTGMPPVFPNAIAMSLELCTYGLVSGYLFRIREYNPYFSLVGAMMSGRAVSGIIYAVLMGFAGREYGLRIFLTTAFVTALPGIVIQLVFVPSLVVALIKQNFVARSDRKEFCTGDAGHA